MQGERSTQMFTFGYFRAEAILSKYNTNPYTRQGLYLYINRIEINQTNAPVPIYKNLLAIVFFCLHLLYEFRI